MANITATDGSQYHLYALGDASAPEPVDSQTFTVLENELSEGYRSRSLFGLNTGIKSWTLSLNTLAGSTVIPAAVVDPYGATVSREDYIRNLYKYNKTTGIPFAYAEWAKGQFYLVDFVDDELTMSKIKGANIYSAELTFRQRRINGVTVFSISKIPVALLGYDWFKETSHGAGVWNNITGGGDLTAAGDVVFSANPQNGHNTVRLSGSASTGVLSGAVFDLPTYEIFIVMKMREATFSNNAGIVTETIGAGQRLLVGTSAGTKFQNLMTATYWLNGVEYLTTDRQAPMNTWGIVQVRIPAGIDLGDAQFGKDGVTAGTFAKADIAEILGFASFVPAPDSRELIEHLATKWGITL